MNQRIDVTSAKEKLDGGNVALIDVRTPGEYAAMNIEGSILIPLDALNPDEILKLVGDRDALLLCRSGKRSEEAQRRLGSQEKFKVIEGGILAWEKAGLPLNRGKGVMSLERQVRIAAGLLVLTGVILGTWVHPGFYGLAAFVGAGLTFAGITDWCGMGLLMAKAPWNQVAAVQPQGASGPQ